MKAILEFDLEDEGDRERHEMAIKSHKYLIALEEIRESIFRRRRKYSQDPRLENEDTMNVVLEMEQEFFDILRNRDIDL